MNLLENLELLMNLIDGTWKATEYRLFLLYNGINSLKNILKEDFLKLMCAIRILCDHKEYEQNNNCAKQLLQNFTSDFSLLY